MLFYHVAMLIELIDIIKAMVQIGMNSTQSTLMLGLSSRFFISFNNIFA